MPPQENPCLSVFKHVSIEKFQRAKKNGDVVKVMDKRIGKRVFIIQGAVASKSFIEIPK